MQVLEGSASLSLSLGHSEFVIPNFYSRYRTQLNGKGIFGIPERITLQATEIELFSVRILKTLETQDQDFVIEPPTLPNQ